MARLVHRSPERNSRRPSRGRDLPLAPDDWGAVARIYDLEHPACRGLELAFWNQEARAAGGRVLELASGSGRIALALARKGHDVTGLELSAGMLARARARLARLPPEVQQRCRWVQGDMSAFSLPGERFGLIFVGFNSFWLLRTLEQQRRCLRCVAAHLAPGGRFIIDVFPPNEDDYRDEDGIAQLLPVRQHGRRLLRVKDYRYDPTTRLATSVVRYYEYDEYAEGEKGRRGTAGRAPRLLAQFQYALRPAEPGEMVALLAEEGFRVEETWGTYARAPLTPASPRAIFVAVAGSR